MTTTVKWYKQSLFWVQDDQKKVLFSDGKNVFCVQWESRYTCVWRFKQEAFGTECLKHSIKFVTSAMVWDCTTLGRLCIISKKSQIRSASKNSWTFWNTYMSEKFCEDNFVLQWDSASYYIFKSTINWLQEKEINVLPWHLNSHDLNPVKN